MAALLGRKWILILLVVVIPLSTFGTVVSATAALGYVHDTDPQEFDRNVARLLGAQGSTGLVVTEGMEYEVDGPNGKIKLVSVIKPFKIKYWDGNDTWFYIPPEIWSAVLKAYGKYKFCDPRLVAIVAHSESQRYTNHATPNRAGAVGVWQFIWSTWTWMWPNAGTRPERTDIDASADAACRYLNTVGVFKAKTQAEFVSAFAVDPPVWNAYPPQAEYVWRAYQVVSKGTMPGPIDENEYANISRSQLNRLQVDYLKWVGLLPEDFVFEYNDGSIIAGEGDEVFIMPEPEGKYVITQDFHNGNKSIDIAGGKGTVVVSSINGKVTAIFFDGLGNPVIIIENARFRVTILHGAYTAKVGDTVKAGQQIGTESNMGNTWSSGSYCGTGSNCGYHTHIFVWDKTAKAFADPCTLAKDTSAQCRALIQRRNRGR